MSTTVHTEASLKAVTVPKLKEILAAAGLSQLGKKDELIIRILAIEIVPTTSTEESISEVTTESAVVPSTCITETVATVVEPVKSAEELSQIAKLDSEKRAARALKFGIVPAVEPVEDAKAARAKRFGAEVPSVETPVGLDTALGSNKREKKGKGTNKIDNPVVKAAVVPKVTPVVDKELASKIAAEEEKKAKRAARFAPVDTPAEKKTKVDV